MPKLTTRVFAVERALFALLIAQTWPPHATTDEEPLIHLGGMAEPPAEVIFLAGVPANAPSQSTATNRSRDETFTLRVTIESWVSGQTALEVSARLEALADVVQLALRDTSGALTNVFNGASPSHPVEGVISWSVTTTRPRHFGLTEGDVGTADIDIEFKTRI